MDICYCFNKNNTFNICLYYFNLHNTFNTLCTHSKNRTMCTQISFVTMLHSVLTEAQEILFLAMTAYAHIIFYSTDTYYLPLNLSL